MKKLISLLLVLTLALSLVACGGGTPAVTEAPEADASVTEAPAVEAPDAAEGEKILYTNGGPEEFFETPWLNPGTYMYNKTVYAHLIVADKNLNPIQDDPDALATYVYSEDGKTLTFELKDAYWHDGEKITPEDIKWSIEYVAKTSVVNPVFLSTFKAIEGAVAEDGTLNETFSGIVIDPMLC